MQKTSLQDRRSPGWVFNPGSPKQEIGVLATRTKQEKAHHNYANTATLRQQQNVSTVTATPNCVVKMWFISLVTITTYRTVKWSHLHVRSVARITSCSKATDNREKRRSKTGWLIHILPCTFVTGEWLALFLRMLKVTRSNIFPETFWHEGLHDFPQFL